MCENYINFLTFYTFTGFEFIYPTIFEKVDYEWSKAVLLFKVTQSVWMLQGLKVVHISSKLCNAKF